MPVSPLLEGRLRLPLIGAPMFIVSQPDLVLAQCRAGIVGAFPSLNARPLEQLDQWLGEISSALDADRAANPDAKIAPFGVNLIVEKGNTRLLEDVSLVVQHKVPLVITSVGPPGRVVEAVHSYGGTVFHDVTNIRHARKAISEGVDGLILVAAGAGGHAGAASPFALIAEVRAFWDGPIVLSGALSHGYQIKAAQLMGADLAYMGTRFIATREAHAPDRYKEMLVEDSMADIVYTPVFSGIPANYLRNSIRANGIDPETLPGPGDSKPKAKIDWGAGDAKAWRDIWSAGQGLGTIHDLPSVADLVDRLEAEYNAATLP